MERFPKIFSVRYRHGEPGQEDCYDSFGSQRFAGRTGWTPHTDILETEDDIVIVMDLAGVGKEDFRVTFEENLLKVSGMRTKRQPPGLMRYHRMEIEYGPFEKLFRVPGDLVDPGQIQAVHRNGFLELSLPKRKTREPTRIEIVHEDSH
jgi:HSP20 family protein